MANPNQSSILNWNSPDYFKLFDDANILNGGGGGGGDANNDGDNGAIVAANENDIGNGNNYNFGSFDFYGNRLTNGIGSNNNGTIASTVPSSITIGIGSNGAHSTVNQTFQYQYDYGGDPHNTSIRSYESGSNFMLLMEDFSAYFYNYNGSVGTGIGTTSSTFNQSFELQSNCSLINSTCLSTQDDSGEFSTFFLFF